MSSIQIKKLQTLTGHKDCLYTLCRYDGKRFFSAGGEGMVVLWDLTNPDMGQMIVKVPASIYALSYEPSKSLLVVGQNFSGIHLVDVESKKEIASRALTDKAIFDIQTTDKAIYVSTGGGELFMLDWELNMLHSTKLSAESARTIAVNEERSELAVGYSDHFIRIFNADNLALISEFKAHDNSVFTLQYHPGLPLLLSAGRDAKIKFWDLDNAHKLVEEIVGHMYTINHIDFAPSGEYFVTCSMDKSIKVWDANQFKLLKVIDKARHAGHATSVNKLLWMDYQEWLVSCSDDRTISVWDIISKIE